MTNNKHTPGPWTAKGQKITAIAGVDQVETVIASTHFRDKNAGTQIGAGRAEINAHLIAAAPDLLAALDRCLKNSELRRDSGVESGPLIEREIEAARAAIAKARGQ